MNDPQGDGGWFETSAERITFGWMTTLILVVLLIMNPLMPSFRMLRGGSAPPCVPGTSIVISSGGTYSGCYVSTDAATAAVRITTTAAVTISSAIIRHKGQGIRAVDARVNLTVQDTAITALDPGTPGDQAALYSFTPSSLTLDNNRFTDGHGILIAGNDLSTSPFQIRRNDFVNVGRYDQPSCCIGAIHLDKVLAAGGIISWNRATATYGQSVNEDVFGIFQSNGASGNPITIDHNLINGSYPYSGNGSGFTGSCINIGDSGGSWQVGDTNTCVNTANNGVMLGNGANMTHTNSTAVSDGKAGVNDSGATVSSTFGNGVVAYHYVAGGAAPTNVTITNNQSGHRRWNGSSFEAADYFTPEADVFTGNTNISPVNAAAEQAALDAWEAARVAAGVIVGPR